MSSNPVLVDDDVLLIPAAEEIAIKDTPEPTSISHGTVYPRWPEDPNRLPIGLTLPRPSPPLTQAMEMQGAERYTVIQIQEGSRRVLSPTSADPPVSFTAAYVGSCVVYWCFCLALGGIAYVIAAIGENYAYEGNIAKAKNWRLASMVTSVSGVVVGIILIILIFTAILPNVLYNKRY